MAPIKGNPNEAKRLEILIKKRENERKRRERIKSDPELLTKQKEKERLKYLKKKEKGAVKSVLEMTPREQRNKRKQWKLCKRKQRMKDKTTARVEVSDIDALIPDDDEPITDLFNSPSSTPTIIHSSSKKQAGRRKVRRDRAKVYRELEKTKALLKSANRRAERYRKRYQRMDDLYRKQNGLTPRSKVNKMLAGAKFVSKEVKRSLLFGEILNAELQEGYKSLPDDKSRQIFTKVIQGKTLKKYKLLGQAGFFLTPKRVRANRLRKYLIYERKKRNGLVVSNELKNKVVAFLEEDSNSRMCPGKKDCVTYKKTKRQKRYLNDTLMNLHKKFLQNTSFNVSYTTFTRLRPFWIVSPKLSDRDTVLCRIHDNMRMLVGKLHENKLIDYKTPDLLLETLCCNKSNLSCLLKKCSTCKGNAVVYNAYQLDAKISYMKWNIVKEKFTDKSGQEKTCKKFKKEEIIATFGQTVSNFEAELPKYIDHIATQMHQYKEIQQLKNNMKSNEILIHIDFSENYACKYANEIQAIHFVGGEQITLHTGILYWKDENDVLIPLSFCTLSDSLRHDAAAIWAHLHPVLQHHLEAHPNVDTIHGLSDSPSNQYRNKTMFYVIKTVVNEAFPNIKLVTWNYTEAGHGKGAPDGIGGLLKRTADRIVAQGTDIANYQALFETLEKEVIGVKLTAVTKKMISDCDDLFAGKPIQPFKGTTKVHQVSWSEESLKTSYRKLSCFDCSPGKCCKHYEIKPLQKPAKQQGRLRASSKKSNPLQVNEHYTRETNTENCSLTNLQIGDWVVVVYDSRLYPGEITNIGSCEYEIDAMESIGNGVFKWPSKRDVCIYHQDDIKLKISAPLPCKKQSGSRITKFYFLDFPA